MATLSLSSPVVHILRFQSLQLTPVLKRRPNFNVSHGSVCRRGRAIGRPLIMAISSMENDSASHDHPQLVTFLGKGGSGRTTAAVFAAQHFAATGHSTCLVTHSQDAAVEYLLNCRLGNAPVVCHHNLSAVRLETTKLLLEPLVQIKQADARVNMMHGVLDGIVGEELGILPGMDPIFSVFALMRLIGLVGENAKQNQTDKFDVIIYDCISTTEMLRMMGAASSARLYLKYLRSIADKTDFGRLAGPSILGLVSESLNASQSNYNVNSSSQIWDSLDRLLKRGSSIFASPNKFGCYVVMDPCNVVSVNTALRHWGYAIQAGSHISGAFGIGSPHSGTEASEDTKKRFSPLPYAIIPDIWKHLPPDWDAVMLNLSSNDARGLLGSLAKDDSCIPAVKFDTAQKSVTLFMPGFDKSEIKLYQYRGGSELLVEAGDQRRVIQLPHEVQGKVGSAKFLERNLVKLTVMLNGT
ncbi:hypothetical protein V2J09_011030 [Rumex salicifolius]